MGYGLHEEHFDLFVDAFLWTIGAGLGDSWDHSIKRVRREAKAWESVERYEGCVWAGLHSVNCFAYPSV